MRRHRPADQSSDQFDIDRDLVGMEELEPPLDSIPPFGAPQPTFSRPIATDRRALRPSGHAAIRSVMPMSGPPDGSPGYRAGHGLQVDWPAGVRRSRFRSRLLVKRVTIASLMAWSRQENHP